MESIDKHCQSIDFSNSCRQFYITRLKATEDFKRHVEKSKGHDNTGSRRTSSTIDNAMETLRKEMASLMDQDLSLMKQLLTLNETIEDIKFRRLHATSQDSIVTSSCNLDNSRLSINDECRSEVDAEDVPFTCVPVPTVRITCVSNNDSMALHDNNFVKKEMTINGNVKHIIHGRGNFSMDSGYDEADDYQTAVGLTL